MPTKQAAKRVVNSEKAEKILAYELTYILDEKAAAEHGKKKTADLTKVIASFGGTVTKEEPWGRRELAYPIKRNRSGYYVTLWLDLPANKVKDLESQLRFDEEIIRSLVTKAYTVDQPGTLYPVVEEEKQAKTGPAKDDKASAEEMLRRSSATVATKKEEPEELEEEVSEEERQQKLDEALKGILEDDEEAS